MPTKPATVPTWATDTNLATGPASGNPTKLTPPGWPNVAQGLVPGDGAVAEFLNKVLNNVCSEWITWVNGGSSAGAADKHIVETDSSGKARAPCGASEVCRGARAHLPC